MIRVLLRRCRGPVLALSLASGVAAAGELHDLHFGEALFYAEQGYYFDALQRLDAELGQHYGLDEPRLDSLNHHIGEAEFFVGDFELNYRMHHRAGRAIRAVLEGDVAPTVRNEAAFRLARIHFQKGQMRDALNALERIDARLPEALGSDVAFLRANVYLAVGRPADAAETLRDLQGDKALRGFSAYNLGVALLRDGRQDEALAQFDRAGQLDPNARHDRAVRDKANLTLGTLLFEQGRYAEAKTPLQRVRLDGPFSNQALLRAGWADVSSSKVERALVPWSMLAKREPTDAAVQEALLAVPYAYGQLGVHGRAAVLYGQALDTFDHELDRLDASIDSIREGHFLEALVREEIHQDKNWVVRMRALPQAPETFYLLELMAAHDFQTALDNYLDLEELRRKLLKWQEGFTAFEDMIRLRRAYYEPLLPEVDHQFRQLDSRMRLRLQQYELLARRLQGLLVMPRPGSLATAEERQIGVQLQGYAQRLDAAAVDAADPLRERISRLQGVIVWMLRTSYDERLNQLDRNLRGLQGAVDALRDQYQGYVRVRQAAVHSFAGYDRGIGRLRTRVEEALVSVEQLMKRQGRMLERVAIRELESRRDRLEGYQDRARYAMADSYDRAAQLRAEVSP